MASTHGFLLVQTFPFLVFFFRCPPKGHPVSHPDKPEKLPDKPKVLLSLPVPLFLPLPILVSLSLSTLSPGLEARYLVLMSFGLLCVIPSSGESSHFKFFSTFVEIFFRE